MPFEYGPALKSIQKPPTSGSAMGSTAGINGLMNSSAQQNNANAKAFGPIPRGGNFGSVAPIQGGMRRAL